MNDTEVLIDALHRDGVAGMPAAFSRSWARRLRADAEVLLAEALALEGGTVSRGPQRHYFAVHPERLHGFADLAGHPQMAELAERVLGPDFVIAEVGFDVPLPGATHQPWHRDFPMPEDTRRTGVLTSLAFNVSAADVTPELGPFEYAPGTQWQFGDDFEHQMFPPAHYHPVYEAQARRRCPQLGDASVRTGLAIHRGTPNRTDRIRPMLVVGFVAPHVDTSDAHCIEITAAALARLPEAVRRRLRCEVVDELAPMVQRHDIEGLMMGG